MRDPTPRPPDCSAALVLADGTLFWGRGLGAIGTGAGEVCFNTAVTGYQEILTDPSYAGQIIACSIRWISASERPSALPRPRAAMSRSLSPANIRRMVETVRISRAFIACLSRSVKA